MAKRQVIISDRALNAFHRIIQQVKTNSLVGAEDARMTIISRLRKLGANPGMNTRVANFATLDGEFRSALAWNYRIYFKVEEDRIIVLDMILDKDNAETLEK